MGVISGIKGAAPIPGYGSNIQSSGNDGAVRSLVEVIDQIVPTINFGRDVIEATGVADRFYANMGACESDAQVPLWFLTTGGTEGANSYNNWDATALRLYANFSGANRIGKGHRMIYPTGPFGTAPTYAPKARLATKVKVWFEAAFPTNANYGLTTGIGGSSANAMGAAADHSMSLTRQAAGNWALTTADGAATSTTLVAGADASAHQFLLEWTLGVDVKAYVDAVLLITKTTNLPAEPLGPIIETLVVGNPIRLYDYLVEWE